MKDIGSIFPIYRDNIDILSERNNYITYDKNIMLYTSLCRESLFIIANINLKTKNNKKRKKIMLPAYTCSTVVKPFLQEGWEIRYYGITKDLRIEKESFVDIINNFNPDLLLVHGYYGVKFNDYEIELIKYAKSHGIYVVEDKTQCIFTDLNFELFDCVTASIRKYCAIPDGAFLAFKNSEECKIAKKLIEESFEYSVFVNKQFQAMLLRGDYFVNGDEKLKTESRKMNKEAVNITYNDIIVHRISEFSIKHLKFLMNINNSEKRKENFLYLNKNIKFNSEISRVYNCDINNVFGPLYYPIYCKDRIKIQNLLSNKKIYAPTLWPIMDKKLIINSDVEYIYEHILVLPVAQTYGLTEMNFIIETLDEISK